MSAPNYQGVGTSNAISTSGTLSPTNPTHLAGDLLVMMAQMGGTDFGAGPGGTWVLVSVITVGTELFAVWVNLAASGAVSNPTTTPTVPNHAYAVVHSARNVHQVHPYTVIAKCGAFASGSTIYLPGGEALVDDGLLFLIGGYNGDAVGPTFSSETNGTVTLTERGDEGTALGNGGGNVLYTAPVGSALVIDTTVVTAATSTGVAAIALLINPIADQAITVQVTLNGADHSSGDGTVRLYDITQPAANYLVVDAATKTTDHVTGLDSDGQADFLVPYNDHEYVAFYFDDTGSVLGSSDPIAFSGGFPTATIAIETAAGGGSGPPPSNGEPRFVQDGVLRVPS